jgi:hypothetical protein
LKSLKSVDCCSSSQHTGNDIDEFELASFYVMDHICDERQGKQSRDCSIEVVEIRREIGFLV